jgi:hypothetical protein
VAFSVPGAEPRPLPHDFQEMINTSVAAFEKKLGIFRQQSWVDEYRAELVRIVSAVQEQPRWGVALERIRNIKDVIPFDSSEAATECIRIAKEALARV